MKTYLPGWWRAAVAAPLLAMSFGCARRTAAPSDAPAGPGRLLTPQELVAIPHSAPDQRLAYGPDSSQYGELRVPAGPGPHPVVVLLHGGCWTAAYASAPSIAPVADALKADGIATWNVEYRRLGEPGGGWPGTYQDVGRAVDHLRALAAHYALDLGRVVVVGHSSGGHLAVWAAARARLPAASPLHADRPLPLRGVVSLGGMPDLEAYMPGEVAACGSPVVEALLGGTRTAVPARYAEGSPARLLPLGVPQVVVAGARDPIIPLALAQSYARAATAAGDRVRLVVIPGAGHFELGSPRPPAWPPVEAAIRALLDGRLPPDAAPPAARQPR